MEWLVWLVSLMWHLLLFLIVMLGVVVVGLILIMIVFGLARILREDNEEV
jgi:NhaP-type Na+/H+ or K+/H+ antiporter